ncbi:MULTISPECIES: hypothetical protein [unclassified Sphingomonas]|uniref:hypothetical protein n=1 Tax=unclassified Sphingomonas TaxID=196159 RepID=UPI000BDD3663|nr:MAG: hypothetical protein B7Y98_03505 [Sphingomonas sp. 32-62-10]
MTLKALAHEALARIAAQDVSSETVDETRLQRMKQGGEPCFTDAPARFIPMKHANPQKTAKNDVCFTVSFPRDGTRETGAIMPDGWDALPDVVIMGLRRLETMARPCGVDPAAWAEVVVDALRMADDGTAANAMALGWTMADLFGAVPDRESLAVWLRGRGPVFLCGDLAIVDVDATRRSCFNRAITGGVPARMLWEMR